ncbi:MAG: HAD-IIB family hydrolase [Thiohalophilus sp.]|jgi:sucrose-6F-phosphate phosphohydrolase
MNETILICTDLDRTLIPNGHEPESPGARRLLRQLVKREDVYLAYVSGRDKVLLEEAIAEWELPVPDFAIGDVGTSIYAIKEDNWKLMQGWRKEISQDWRNYRREDIARFLEDIDSLTLQEPHKQNDFKLSYYTPPDTDNVILQNEIRERLAKYPIEYNVIWSIDDLKNIGLLDILPKRANKLESIRFLIHQNGFSAKNTVFSGDSGNDLEVLTSELQATLVNNASDNIKHQAQDMARSHGHMNCLYIAHGNFLGMNGNYAAGILEGLAHYIPRTRDWLEQYLA